MATRAWATIKPLAAAGGIAAVCYWGFRAEEEGGPMRRLVDLSQLPRQAAGDVWEARLVGAIHAAGGEVRSCR